MGLMLLTVTLAMAGYAFALKTMLGDAGFKQFDKRLNDNVATISKVVKKGKL